MFCRILSAGIEGLSAKPVYVEADVAAGLPSFHMVGMLSGEVREAKERVERALINSGISLPPRRITINLSPANFRKNGTGFDIAIAVAVLVCLGIVKEEAVKGRLFVGELSLDGTINRVNGILPVCILSKQEQVQAVIVPSANVFEGAVIKDLNVCGASDLKELIRILNEDALVYTEHVDLEEKLDQVFEADLLDYMDIRGQESAKRATMIAVAGFHNLLYVGPPGSGKSMMAARIPSILNRMTVEECLEVSRIYSVAGMLKDDSLVLKRPFRSPHSSVSPAALVGGSSMARPGEITLAHNGVLFLDEAAQFKKDTIDLLRQPLENRMIAINRLQAHENYPADFMLVMSANPCPCGFYPDRTLCRCSETEIDRYFGKLRGPVLDRIDICTGTSKVTISELKQTDQGMSSADMRAKICLASEIQQERFCHSGIRFNSQMGRSQIERFCEIGPGVQAILDQAYERMNLTARGYYKILKVARTIADTEASSLISKAHILEAVGYRNLYSD